MTSGRLGSGWEPRADTVIRLARWRRLAGDGVPTKEIAVAVGLSHRALDQMVVRARRHGHPDAIRHPNAGAKPGEGLRHVLDGRARRARIHANSTRGATS